MQGAMAEDAMTRNERLVLEVLGREEEPMKAYELLAALKDKGVKAPMTVYRALDRLELRGLVHKLDAMNAFVACNHDQPHRVQMFTMCSECSKVTEIKEQRVTSVNWQGIAKIGTENGFEASSARVELRGICAECRSLS
ncbi:transcriptional regulator (Fur family protein) [Parvularcula bermudensis HTCC2503]|uniref:Transcriptional regulator (Fur family protein) n=1 Tax=Parvularcula bermudensis (strain ATCC BAA-594 / HTCC2503 / KCTC 12087) TaxID=314260 RepID=E0TBT5_PARBH|nr:Fur family transcriptional regulator [Parvularcula bermudensis]ADM08428.1 transcriptional regulator (Fur family protein) [Parvularcula bermudensis HTCC2503]